MRSTAVSFNSSLRRSPMGQKRKQAQQHEATQAKTLEGTSRRMGLFQLHKLDFLHLSQPQRDTGTLKRGHPDYLVIGKGWSAYIEIKAHDKVSGYMGKLATHQRSFHTLLRQAGHEVMTFWLPDDLKALDAWLRGKTGIVVDVDGLIE